MFRRGAVMLAQQECRAQKEERAGSKQETPPTGLLCRL